MLPFDQKLLEMVRDVADGVVLGVARETLETLGFIGLPAIGRTLAWVHPGGLLVGAGDVLADQSLSGVRMGVVLNAGWREASATDCSAFSLRGNRWLCADGQAMAQGQTPLSGTTTLIGVLRGIHETGAQIEPFSRWGEMARQDQCRDWLFVFGHDKLQEISEQGDVVAWLGQVDPGLGTFVQDRLDRMHSSRARPGHGRGRTTKEDAMRFIGRVEHVRAVAQAFGSAYPSQAQSDVISRWVQGPGKKADYQFLDGGLNQGSVLAIGSFDRSDQLRLLGWIKHAPVDVLERALVVGDAAGKNMTMLLLESMVDFRHARAAGMGQFTARCLQALCSRVGAQAVQTGLHLGATPLGVILGATQKQENRAREWNGLDKEVIGLLDVLDANGVRVASDATLAPFQKPVAVPGSQRGMNTRAIGGSHEQLALACEKLPGVSWGHVQSRVCAMALGSIVEGASERGRAAPRI